MSVIKSVYRVLEDPATLTEYHLWDGPLGHQRDVPLLVHSRLFSEAVCNHGSRGHMLRAAAALLGGGPLGLREFFVEPCVGGSDTLAGL